MGYQVRLDRRISAARGAIEFVTVGVLLRRLADDATAAAAEAAAADGGAATGSSGGGVGSAPLGGVTHIVVDEVHERDVLADFLLIVLRDLLAARPGAFKLVLMSARRSFCET